MIKKESKNQLFTRIRTGIIFGLILTFSYFFAPPIVLSSLLALILLIILTIEWPHLLEPRQPMFWLLMPFYPVLPFVLLIMMNQSPTYHALLIPLFLLVFSHDTGSYIAGTLFGKHAIASSISPNKTWEGFLGGYIFTYAALLLYLKITGALLFFKPLALFTLIACTVSLIGDFFESRLKRKAGIKDTGSLLPGHGGFLDRFDGVMFTTILFYAFKDYLLTLFGL